MQSTKVELDIAIIGAGLAGLASALSLARRGHHVTVLESRDSLSEAGAGVQIPPNASRILTTWGLANAFEQKADLASRVLVKRYVTGELLVDMVEDARKRFGYPTWLLFRTDFQRILYDAAIDAGAAIRFGVTGSVRQDHDAVMLELSDNSTLMPDVILAADGIGSRTRGLVVDEESAKPVVHCNAYRALIPREKMLNDPATAELMAGKHRQVWLGPARTVVAYPIAGGKYYNMIMEHPGHSTPGVWTQPGDVMMLRQTYEDFEPLVRKLLGLVDECSDWALARVPELPTWVGDSGRLVLIGDAAHATTPQLAQGAAMCIEDAAVLTECLSRIETKDEIANALAAFQDIRKERAERVQLGSLGNFNVWTLPDGPAQEQRDQKFATMMQPKPVQQIQTGEKQPDDSRAWLYGYDAIAEAVQWLSSDSSQH